MTLPPTAPEHQRSETDREIALEDEVTAHNYHPLPVVLASAEGAWVTDVDGRRYLDCLAGYSALNFGHGHPAILAAARAQLDRLTLTSRAFHNDQLGPFCRDLAALAGMDLVLPMNTGAEAVEAAVKVSRKWGYDVRGVAPDQATIVVAEGNFHGRTTTIISFSTDPVARAGFGPFTPGFRVVPYGDAAALREAVDDTTVAVLIEPIQGEAGVRVPPEGYLASVRDTCTQAGVLMVADEIQSGLGRTGSTFACELEGVVPDVYVLGKALGGGVVPVSAVLSSHEVLGVLTPGTHGSTFGGNPLACAVGHAVVRLLETGEFQARAASLGEQLRHRLDGLIGHGVTQVRSRGLWAGVDIDPALMTGRQVSEQLLPRGVLVKDTHGSTIRLAPPIVVEPDDLDWMVDQIEAVLTS
jgi:ornithine--oxo-acid transaminase